MYLSLVVVISLVCDATQRRADYHKEPILKNLVTENKHSSPMSLSSVASKAHVGLPMQMFLVSLDPSSALCQQRCRDHPTSGIPTKIRGGGRASKKRRENALPQQSAIMQMDLGEEIRDGLKAQIYNNLQEHGASVTIMVAGESGLGKTSLLSSLFRTEVAWPGRLDGKTTIRIDEQNVKFDLDGMPFSARLIDSPGYGSADPSKDFNAILGRINAGLRSMLSQEQRVDRSIDWQRDKDGQVDVILYFFAPHRCKPVDFELLKLLRGKVSIIPILAKADSMTSHELASFRRDVGAALAKAQIPVAHPPLAVITGSKRTNFSRVYPWGTAESESIDPAYVHSELAKLRRFLLTDGLLPLKQASQDHYESYRMHALQEKKHRCAKLRWLLSRQPAQVFAIIMCFREPRTLIKQKCSVALVKPAKFLLKLARHSESQKTSMSVEQKPVRWWSKKPK